MSEANVKCPCGGRLKPTDDPQAYECTKCGRRLRQVVVEDMDAFERVAESDGPAAEVAEAALEGVRDE
jgi:tRNA(Ile2) C34 agmatinyltransferase TiaS